MTEIFNYKENETCSPGGGQKSGQLSFNEMSSSENGSGSPSPNCCHYNSEDKICRDFMRKVCHRGNQCKYLHPKDNELEIICQSPKRVLTFCHDFQNGLCSRSTCRFIHCTVGEEDYYLRTGNVLPHILEQATHRGQIINTPSNGEAPICKDYIVGVCLRKRGGKCRFRHLTKAEYEHEVYCGGEESPQHNGAKGDGFHSYLGYSDSDFNNPIYFFTSDHKRQRMDPELVARDHLCHAVGEISRDDILLREMSIRSIRDRDHELDRERDHRGFGEILLMRKNLETLTQEIATLKKENSDLRATNDFLLEKVTTLGLSKGGTTVTTVAVPTVTLAATTIPVATSVRPLMAAQVSHPLSITTECSVGSIVAITPPHPPQRVQQSQQPSQSLAPPQQQVGVTSSKAAVLGTVAVSISQAPQTAFTAVSIASVTLNPPIVTATSMSPTIGAPGTAMSISGTTGAHIVSYPIMHTGLIPAIQ